MFTPLRTDTIQALEHLPRVLEAVLPLRPQHRRHLPEAIAELSTRLTSERDLLHHPYWSVPRLMAAYIWYFLPWNILRLLRLLGGLVVSAPPATSAEPPLWIDMGSGPLTLPLALWLARPEWRDMPLRIVCMDTSTQPMEIGRSIFMHMAGPKSPWRVHIRRTPLEMIYKECQEQKTVPWLISGANVLNECKPRPQEAREEYLGNMLDTLARACASPHQSQILPSQILLVEPGTRLGGNTLSLFRNLAVERDFVPLAPCTHAAPCPVHEGRSWCHFTFDTQGAPAWLARLSQQAGLHKEGLSLAFMHLSAPSQATVPPHIQSSAQPLPTRCISAPFMVPQVRGKARYGCNAQGLVLLENAQNVPSGFLTMASSPHNEKRVDAKTRAPIMQHDNDVRSP